VKTGNVPHNNVAAGGATCVGRVSSNLPQPTKRRAGGEGS